MQPPASSHQPQPLDPSLLKRTVAAGNQLGEGPLWHPVARRLFWVDITAKQVHSCDAAGHDHRILNIDAMPGSLHLTRRADELVVTTPDALLRLNTETGQRQRLCGPVEVPAGMRFNDGKTDSAGRIWAGTMTLNGDAPRGILYRIESVNGAPAGSAWNAHPARESLTIPNGLAWTRDNTRFYHIDTPTRRVQSFEFDPHTGELGNTAVALSFDKQSFDKLPGAPDGMTIDEEDKLWIAFWGGGQVCRFDPASGELLSRVEIPAPHVTSCCFGGDDYSELFITTARKGLSDEQLARHPESGNLFRLKPGVKGRPEPVVAGLYSD